MTAAPKKASSLLFTLACAAATITGASGGEAAFSVLLPDYCAANGRQNSAAYRFSGVPQPPPRRPTLSPSSFIRAPSLERQIPSSAASLSSSARCWSKRSSSGEDASRDSDKAQRKRENGSRTLTLGDLSQRIASNPAKYLTTTRTTSPAPNEDNRNRNNSKRTRRRVLAPKQKYLYKSQRENGLALVTTAIKKNSTMGSSVICSGGSNDGPKNDDKGRSQQQSIAEVTAREMGLVSSMQHCDPICGWYPRLVGRVTIGRGEEEQAVDPPDAIKGRRAHLPEAFIVEKPPGWSILGSGTGSSGKGGAAGASSLETPGGTDDASVVVDSDARNADIACDSTCSDDLPRLHRSSSRQKQEQHRKRVKIVESDGSTDVLEYSELDVMALLTPEELEEYLAEQCSSRDGGGGQAIQTMNAATQRNPRSNSRSSSGTKNDTDDDQGYSDDEEMTPVVEITSVLEDEESEEIEALNPNRAANLQRIAARSRPASSTVAEAPSRASFAPAQRPSVVAWLKEEVGGSGNTTIRGGTYWTAVAGATRVDDSGLVVLAPRHKVDGIRITSAEYLAVLGTGGFMAKAAPRESDKPEDVQVEVVSRLRKGRSDDPIDVVRVQSTNPSTSCSSIIEVCQDAFQQGVRGDAEANPFDRRGPRRLVHCGKISLSSKAAGSRSFDASSVPFDAAVFLDRGRDRNKLFTSGSFLGRMSFKNSSTTNAFREINAAADGFPGWTVDRYDHWLFVQHNSGTTPLGPLPSIHDGNTAGVYLLEQSNPDRSADGSIRPRLLEGRVAPDRIPILENGITYHVSFQDMSTGIFLDQRPQRAWLARNCGPNTRVLNCFAHSGAYSVAAATAGASTVSVDLSRKWLERLPDQLRANEIDFDERHDAIYGDCFDWLARLAKRGEKYDIVILDPPSSSVGGRKKRRWSVKNDMDELVSLAAGLVKKGGLLWTTTNNAGIHPIKFARVCKKGLEDAGLYDAKLERLQPMPGDFPSIGPQSVKNLVWRIP